jgi:hypothetical protein
MPRQLNATPPATAIGRNVKQTAGNFACKIDVAAALVD